jgi:hypothetical protein
MLSFSSEQAGYVVGWLMAATVIATLLRSFARKLLGLDAAVEGDDAR